MLNFCLPQLPGFPLYAIWRKLRGPVVSHAVANRANLLSMKQGMPASDRSLQAEKHSEVDKAWELKLSKKYNDLAGCGGQAMWKFEDTKRPAVWEAAYPDQNTPHAFTGLLQRFQHPMGDCNHEILCTLMPKVCRCMLMCWRLAAPAHTWLDLQVSRVSSFKNWVNGDRCFYVKGEHASIISRHKAGQ